jgi:type I restriction enzyme S subunit
MIADLKHYPAMKNSGVEWLGEVPEHWDVTALKWAASFKYGKSLSSTDRQGGDVAVYGSNGIVGYHDRAITNAPCIIIGRKGSYGKVNFSYSPCFPIDTTYFIDPSCTENDLSWLSYLLPLLKLDEYSKDSAVPGLNRNDAYVNMVALPPLSEQSSIVRFLDYVDRRIRRYIRAKQKLIELLEEQKQAIIHRSVTRGLDPNVPLKPSGVEWLGDVPAHWEIRRLKYITSICTGGKDTVDRIEDGHYPFFVRSQKIERINTYSFDGEAVLTAGDGVGVAKVFHYIDGKFDYHQRVYKFSNFHHVYGKFFFNYFSRTLRCEAFRGTAKSTVDSLRLPMLENFPVLIPTLVEQKEIVEIIQSKTIAIDSSLRIIKLEIELLLEYRTRLIADVVTGKVDIREVAVNIPDEADGLMHEYMAVADDLETTSEEVQV